MITIKTFFYTHSQPHDIPQKHSKKNSLKKANCAKSLKPDSLRNLAENMDNLKQTGMNLAGLVGSGMARKT
jgi:hypothetical protein